MTDPTPDIPETPDSQANALPLQAAELIADEARRAPDKPGVYRMYGEDGACLYVGKAKSLKKRVVQYAQGRFHTQRIGLMVSLTRAMELVVTASETEALLLESNFIKKLKPRFNVLLRDDKSFAELMIRRDHRAPQVRKHRGAHTIPGDYFGPFASTWAVNHTLNTLQKAFLLRSCSDSVYETRTRPCMLHQIKRCSAPCTGLISLEDYGELVSEAEQFLRGKSRAVIGRLSQEMQAASDDLDFETAARVRDRIRALSAIAMENSVNADGVAEADVFALHAEGGQACVQVFFYRAGQNWGGRAYFPRVDKSDSDPEILAAFLGQFYEDKPVPRLILSNVRPHELELLEEAFSMKAEHRVEIARPQRGGKASLVDHALTNAREALGRKLAENSAQSKILDEVCEAFGLDARPERIEVYDNAHIQGTNAVGGMVVAGPEGFRKNQYRKFNIRGDDLTPGDDYGMMREVMRRRFGKMVKDEEAGEAVERPDLLLVDGGAGQLAEVLAVMADLGVDDIAVVGVAKGPDRDAGKEHFFMPGKPPFMLPLKSPALYYIQRLRDEAHRFA
ncbi:MAG: excinuclease ABC subunit C, partial [Brevundimonas sp. 67-6]